MIKVIVVDDIPILRNGLRAILSQDQDINVVGLASNGEEAFEMCNKYKPDVVLMDMRMNEFDGAYGTKKIKSYFPKIKVLVLTTFDDSETIESAIKSGADGYILKEMDDDKIIQSIKTVYSGMNIFGQGIFERVRNNVNNYKISNNIEYNFTERELEIIKYVANGLGNKEIASKLFLAEGTVRNNISKLLEKLKLKDRTQLAVFAVKNNMD